MRQSTRQFTDAGWATTRYNEIRHRLPQSDFPSELITLSDLGEIEHIYNTFLFDSFGVLNVGDQPIPGAIERVGRLRSLDKKVFVLTNAASVPLSRQQQKYKSLGFDFDADEIVSSRFVLTEGLKRFDKAMEWRVIAGEESEIEDLDCDVKYFKGEDADAGDGIIFLSSEGWHDGLQRQLLETLGKRPRPFLIGNPDLAAPRESHFTKEPGAFAHDIADQLDLQPEFYGKPFGNAFDCVKTRLGASFSPERTLMIGDTLHTDILGGAAAGIKTALITDHGLLKGLDPNEAIDASQIRPDYLMPNI